MSGLLEAGRRAIDAGIAAVEAGARSVPGAHVAIGACLGALAAEIFHHAAEVAELFGARLELVELVACAAVMDEMHRVGKRPLPLVDLARAEPPGRDHVQCFGQPARMDRAAGDIDHRHAGLRAEIRPEQSAFLLAVIGKPAGFDFVRAGRGDAAISRAASDRDHMTGLCREVRNPVHHRPVRPRHHMEAPGPVRPAHHRAFEAEDVERLLAGDDPLHDVDHRAAALLAQRRMPKHLDIGRFEGRQQVRAFRADQRQRAAAAAAGLHPEKAQGTPAFRQRTRHRPVLSR